MRQYYERSGAAEAVATETVLPEPPFLDLISCYLAREAARLAAEDLAEADDLHVRRLRADLKGFTAWFLSDEDKPQRPVEAVEEQMRATV